MLLRLHVCASQDIALPAGSKRPMLIWQEAFDTTPCEGTENYQLHTRQHEGQLWTDCYCLLTVPHELWELPVGSSELFQSRKKVRVAESTRSGMPQVSPSLWRGQGLGCFARDESGKKVTMMPKMLKGSRESCKVRTALRNHLTQLSFYSFLLYK